MRKILTIVFMIVGTIIGSGFASGREILVFFSRFGVFSYVGILIACVLFYFLLVFFLTRGSEKLKRLESSDVLSLIMVFCSIVFAGSMFAGTASVFNFSNNSIKWAYTFVLFLICLYFTFKGIKSLEKFNLFFMPIIAVLFFAVLLQMLPQNNTTLSCDGFSGAVLSMLYSFLYVLLNMSISSIVISKSAGGMSKKEAKLASFISVLIIAVFLILGNFVLLRNLDSFNEDMPFLFLSEKLGTLSKVVMTIIIFFGCITTLLSLCITIKNCLQKFVKNNKKCSFFAVFVPLFLSFLGFSTIINVLYPISSIIGGFLMLKVYYK